MVSKDGTLVVGKRKERIKTIIEHVGVLGVFVKNNARDLDVTNFTVENSGFA